jgi:hypothetical protein
MMAVLAGNLEAHREDRAPVAGKSMLNRLELSKLEPTRYHKISHNPIANKRLLVDLVMEARRMVCILSFGLAKNDRLIAEIRDELAAAEKASRRGATSNSSGRRARAGAANGGSSPKRSGCKARATHASS